MSDRHLCDTAICAGREHQRTIPDIGGDQEGSAMERMEEDPGGEGAATMCDHGLGSIIDEEEDAGHFGANTGVILGENEGVDIAHRRLCKEMRLESEDGMLGDDFTSETMAIRNGTEGDGEIAKRQGVHEGGVLAVHGLQGVGLNGPGTEKSPLLHVFSHTGHGTGEVTQFDRRVTVFGTICRGIAIVTDHGLFETGARIHENPGDGCSGGSGRGKMIGSRRMNRGGHN